MIEFRLFKYPFCRYITYNMLYSILFCLIPILCYAIIMIHIVIKSDNEITVQDIMESGIDILRDKTIIIDQIDIIDIICLTVFVLSCSIGYVYMNKVILNKVLFDKYKKIVLDNNIPHVSWLISTIFSMINIICSVLSTVCILILFKLVNHNKYDMYFYSLQTIGFIVSWILTYYLLNRLIEYCSKVKLKQL